MTSSECNILTSLVKTPSKYTHIHKEKVVSSTSALIYTTLLRYFNYQDTTFNASKNEHLVWRLRYCWGYPHSIPDGLSQESWFCSPSQHPANAFSGRQLEGSRGWVPCHPQRGLGFRTRALSFPALVGTSEE